MPNGLRQKISDTPADTSKADPGSTELVNRLERLVVRFLRIEFKTSAELWRLQVDLFDLQQEIQRRITESKSTVRAGSSERAELEQLRYLRSASRRFGDAIAWVMLGMDRRVIYALAMNTRVPVEPRQGHGRRGLLVAAEAMSNKGAGFPLLHDITDMLRIGDITFVTPGREPFTVEVKTQLLNEEPSGPNTVSYTYNVAVMSADANLRSLLMPDLDTQRTARPPVPVDPDRSARPRHRLDERARRQLDRMHKVKQQLEAPLDVVVEAGDERFIATTAEVEGGDHSASMRRVARRTRRSGFAVEAVEDGLIYAGVYDVGGFDGIDLNDRFRQLTDAVANEKFLNFDGRDGIFINTVPATDQRSAELYLPYFVHNLPRATIIDLLRGRMILFVIVNPGRIAAALDNAGFETSLDGPAVRPAFNLTASDGSTFRCELRNLRMPMMEMIMEFQPVERLVAVADAMRGTIGQSVIDGLAAQRRAG